MRKFAVAALLLLAVASAVPASADPGAALGAAQVAEADWIVVHGPNDVKFYFAAAMRMAAPEGLITYGVVGKGDCVVNRHKHGWAIICHGSGRGKELALDQFEFDPALRSASMRFKAGGFNNAIHWTGRDRLPWVGEQVVAGDGFAGAAAMASSGARARGHLLGRDVVNGPGHTMMRFGYLSQGAEAYAFSGAERTFELAPDGSYRYRVEVMLPR